MQRRDYGTSAGNEGPHDGVPSWLRAVLREWVQKHFLLYDPSGYLDAEVHDELLQKLERRLRVALGDDAWSRWQTLEKRLLANEDFFLDVIQFLVEALYRPDSREDEATLKHLDEVLEEGGSVWTVKVGRTRRLLHRPADRRDGRGSGGRGRVRPHFRR